MRIELRDVHSMTTTQTKTMTVAEMVQAVVTPPLRARVDAFDGSQVGPDGAEFTIHVVRPRALRYLEASPNDLGMARAYLQGDIRVDGMQPGNPYDAFATWVDMAHRIHRPALADGARIIHTLNVHGAERAPKPPSIEIPSVWRRILTGVVPHTHRGDATTVSYHYDQSNEFYADIIGASMTHTCACFPTEDASLEDAQANKLRLVLDKLDLRPGQRLLDIGCGWGSMEVAAARRGIRVLGVTLSQPQVDWATEWIHREGLQDLAEVRLMDYRDVPETGFDGICSLGMMEHVGVSHYASYFAEMFDKLKPGGRLLNHQITRHNSSDHHHPGKFIDRYIFPDGELGAPGLVMTRIHDAGFEVVHEENLRQHYALTLRHWGENLQANWDHAVQQVGEQKARLWGVYLAGSRFSFEQDTIQIHQFLAVRPGADGARWYPLRPWWNA